MDADSLGLIIQDLAIAVLRTNYGTDVDEFSLAATGKLTEHDLCVHMLRGVLEAMPSRRCELLLRQSPIYEKVDDRMYLRMRFRWKEVE